ncbi:beta-ketoacyl-ACP synthase II [Clostridium coskatii]|uniref:3-oxoacyl-[acyl-carrier-protein] synthase 2 n=1 Tax=Clostridium coskatii TaxID=1705578 RepID=A0A162NFY3_9CLOT|nr:beta-ketoacyl-ACP synthase II [Clostridium coskatii]OAA93079.1 3-oxoacyl-[acyl-carrier-protein] synthase 2 [Clostridium coskatii]OBR90822.1 3-oxoacyl-[acyl-carrier-protein] synthase 2 [Clostridium coskatii]
MEKRVVITGLGAITPVGNDTDTFWNNIKDGVCGIDFIKAFDVENYKAKVAAEVKGFDPHERLDRKESKRFDRFCQFAMVSAMEAVEDSKLDIEGVEKERFGVVIGSGIGGIGTIEKQHSVLEEKGPNRITPLFIPMIISNMAAGNIAIKFGAKGPCSNIVTACATGTNCVGEAFRMIKNNLADVMIAGGTEACITPLSMAGFAAATTLTKSTDPKRASVPFDKERDGFVMGEGSGILILESLEHAQKRGAKIYAELVGYGFTCDAYHMTSPAPGGDGAARAMSLAIEEAGIEKEEVSYINAHGTSTKINDKVETEAIKKAFGDYAKNIPISSTKSMTGHLLGAAGAIEAIISVKALEEGIIPPTIGYKVQDEECDLDYVPNKAREAELKYVMSNSFGFGGHNAVILLKKWSE